MARCAVLGERPFTTWVLWEGNQTLSWWARAESHQDIFNFPKQASAVTAGFTLYCSREDGTPNTGSLPLPIIKVTSALPPGGRQPWGDMHAAPEIVSEDRLEATSPHSSTERPLLPAELCHM